MERFYFLGSVHTVGEVIRKLGFRGDVPFYLFSGYKEDPSVCYVIDCGQYKSLKKKLKDGYYSEARFYNWRKTKNIWNHN